MAITCGYCGLLVEPKQVSSGRGDVQFFLCPNPNCNGGSVRTRNGSVFPPAPASGTVNNLPNDVAAAWREARAAHSVAAYTAAEMMMRKILMHVAVDIAGSKPGKQFVQYLDDLDRAGYITKGLRDVVDRIRKRGNLANHELDASTEDDAHSTLMVTEYLLKGIYEFQEPSQ